MKPILYQSSETAFTSNGLGRLSDCISCTVTEERNGIFECQFDYPITGGMFDEIIEGRIIGVIHDDKKDIQPFDIYARTAPINGVVTFFAHHVSYRLGNVILRPMTASTCAAALAAIPNNTYNSCPFTFWTDKSTTATWTVDVPSAVKAVLGGQQGSILDIYGTGEYEWDKFAVKLHLNRGADNGVIIRYGVNLTDLTQDVDVSGVYTAVVPYWLGTDGTLVTLPEGYIAREGMAVIPVPLDLSQEWENAPTVEQLRTKATSRLNSSNAWLPNENIKVSFVDLSHTEEYKSVAALQRVSLCDQVSVYCGDLDVAAVKVKVVRTVYNVLTEMYDEIELGDPKTTLADTITSKFVDAISDLPTSIQVRSMLDSAVDNATNQITGAAGGFVRFIYDASGKMQEIVIMDTDDIATATKVWRWNSGGLGYSSNGYNGPYGTAITQDGSIVADYITSGTMDANLLRTGIITSPQGGSYWNLDTGVLMIGGMSATDIAANVGTSVTGIDIEYAQNQSSAEAPTTGWSTLAPSWAAGWYIWQRTKTITPDGVEYSTPVCISGRDGSGSTPGLNQATLYLYQRSATQPTKPTGYMTYTFANGVLTGIPAGWTRSIPSGNEPCWVTSAAAISSDTAVTLPGSAWQDAVMMAQNGVTVDHVDDFFTVSDSTIPPSTDEFFQLGVLYPWVDHNGNTITDHNGNPIHFKVTEPPIPTKQKPYVWNFQRTTYTDGTVLDSAKVIITMVGADGIGVENIIEEYYLSTSDQSPTGGSWSVQQPTWQSGRYIWTRTRVVWTDGVETTTDPILATALNSANETAAAASAKADTASAREQLIYHSVVSGTLSIPANTTWVTNSANAQDVWTTTRPQYDSTYPVLYVATQRQTVQQRNGTSCSCTTPVMDQTTTVIDGGHITTGTIDAAVVNVDNINANNIRSGTLSADLIDAYSITASKIAGETITLSKLAPEVKSTANQTEQIVYGSRASKTTVPAIPSTWVTNTADAPNTWSLKRPTYSKTTPYVWVCTQRKDISGTVTCTTPIVDETTTVIDGSHIITGTVTADKIESHSITAAQIEGGTITATELHSGAVTTAKLDSQAVTAEKIKTGTITATQIQGGTITLSELSSGVKSTANQTEQIVYGSRASGATVPAIPSAWVTNASGTDNSWTVKRPAYNKIYPFMWVCTQRKDIAGNVTCTTPVIDDTTTVIDGANIITGSVTANQIEVGTITATELHSGAVTTDKLDTEAVTAAKIATGTITANQIAGSTITLSKMANAVQTSISRGESAYNRKTAYKGTCATAASTATKSVDSDGFVLETGATVTVYHSTANTSTGAITLNVEGTGSKTVYAVGAATSQSNELLWAAGATITYVYDGTYWRADILPGSYRGSQCSESAATSEKTTYVGSAVICRGTTVMVPMVNENTATAATLNVTSTVAKPIYYGTGTTRPTTANGRGWVGNRTVLFEFDGQYWRLGDNATIIDGGHILTGTIDASKVNVDNIKAGNIKSGTMSADRISGGSIDATNVTITNLDASNITGGTMSASKIKGGTLTLGGSSNTNGKITVKNASNGTIGTWDKDGIDITGGSLTNVWQDGANDSHRVVINDGKAVFSYKADGASSYTTSGTIGTTSTGAVFYRAANTAHVSVEAGPNAGTLTSNSRAELKVGYASSKSKIVLKAEELAVVKPSTTEYLELAGVTQSITVVTGVNFSRESVTTKTINITNGIITSIT